MFDDLVGGDDNDGQPQPEPALMLCAAMGQTELLMVYKMQSRVGWTAPNLIMFTHDDETGVEVIEQSFRGHDGTLVDWQEMMGPDWTRAPTPAEAMAFKLRAEALLLAEWWPMLAAAKAEDDARKPGDTAVGPAGRFAGETGPEIITPEEAAAIKRAGLSADPIGQP
jgi:hypothetical protein